MLSTHRDEILNIWIKERLESEDFREELISKHELRQQSQQVVEMLARSLPESDGADFDAASFDELRAFLNEISRQRAIKGYTPSENATYILSLRNVVLAILAEDFEDSGKGIQDRIFPRTRHARDGRALDMKSN